MSADGYRCASCGEWHEGPVLCYAAKAPELYYEIPEADREVRCLLTADVCIVDDEHFFLRGLIELPIIGRDDLFTLGVWVSQSETSREKIVQAWESPERVNLEPTFGWLSTSIDWYRETLNLKTMVHQRPPGQSPLVELEPTDHPLAVEQRNGITWESVCEIDAWARHNRGL